MTGSYLFYIIIKINVRPIFEFNVGCSTFLHHKQNKSSVRKRAVIMMKAREKCRVAFFGRGREWGWRENGGGAGEGRRGEIETDGN
jgi:hypothetical protein